MVCKSIFFGGDDDGLFHYAPEKFGAYILERCRRDFEFDTSRVIAFAKDRLVRACNLLAEMVSNESDLFIEIQLEVLVMLIDTPGSAYQIFVDDDGITFLMSVMASGVGSGLWGIVGHSIVMLEKLCDRTQSAQTILAALKDQLVENLIATTQNVVRLEIPAAMSLAAFVERILPDALVFRTVLDRCGALKVENADRNRLSSTPGLGERWTHLLQLYDERKDFYDAVLRRELRECDNVRFLLT